MVIAKDLVVRNGSSSKCLVIDILESRYLDTFLPACLSCKPQLGAKILPSIFDSNWGCCDAIDTLHLPSWSHELTAASVDKPMCDTRDLEIVERLTRGRFVALSFWYRHSSQRGESDICTEMGLVKWISMLELLLPLIKLIWAILSHHHPWLSRD